MIMSDAPFRKLIQLRAYRRSDERMRGRDNASLIDLLAHRRADSRRESDISGGGGGGFSE